MPLLTPLLQRRRTFDWSHETTAQRHAGGALHDRRSRWPAGRGFGGSQILNNMLWTRGHRDDYRGWFGGANEDYDYERDVAPYFRAAERAMGGAPTELPYRTRLAQAVMNASRQFGYDSGEFGVPLVTQRNGRRHTNAHAERSRRRAGHERVMGAHVVRLLFDETVAGVGATGDGLTVVGVVYERGGQTVRVRATHGVVLSAGTVGSPLILQASGIGPRDVLLNETAGTATGSTMSTTTTTTATKSPSRLRLHLPAVGRHLQDHVTTGLDLVLLREPLGVRPWELLSPHAIYQYAMHGTGPLTMCGCEALGFVHTDSTAADAALLPPDLGFMVLPTGASGDGGAHLRHVLNIAPPVWSSYFAPLVGQPTASIVPVLLHPHSRGTVRWTADGSGVRIDPNYLADERDVETLVTGVRIVEQLLEQPALRRLGAELNPQPFPGCGHLEFRSVRYWRCYVRELTLTAFHPVGTCRMGADAADAVVGWDFAVHGVRRLWVVDASVMPTMPSGNPNAAVAMLAQRFVALHRRATATTAARR